MRAIVIEEDGNGPQLVLRNDVDEPRCGPDDLLVRVRAAGVNFADLRRSTTHYGHGGGGSSSEHAVAGLEMAGEVVTAGSGVKGFSAGDRVMAMASRTYAEFAAVDHRLALRVPASFGWNEAAATAVSFMTAHDALISNAQMRGGETVLVQAVTSGAGIAATQVAKALGAGKVIGTSGSPEKLERMATLGLDVPVNHKAGDWAAAVRAAAGDMGVDVIIDNIGGSVLPGNVDCAAVKGRIVSVGRLGPHTGEINLDELARKRVRLIGVSFRTRSVDEHAEVVRRFQSDLSAMVDTGRIRPVVDRCFSLAEAAEAQAYMKSNRHFGKIVLTVDG